MCGLCQRFTFKFQLQYLKLECISTMSSKPWPSNIYKCHIYSRWGLYIHCATTRLSASLCLFDKILILSYISAFLTKGRTVCRKNKQLRHEFWANYYIHMIGPVPHSVVIFRVRYTVKTVKPVINYLEMSNLSAFLCLK